MANPWPRVLTPNVDPKPMRTDAKPVSTTAAAPSERRRTPRPADLPPPPTAAAIAAMIEASGGRDPRLGYAMRLRHLQAAHVDALRREKSADLTPSPSPA